MRKLVICTSLIFILVLSSCGQKKQNHEISSFFNRTEIQKYQVPFNSGIGDFEKIFTEEQKEELDSIIKVFDQKTTNQIAIVTIDSLGPYNSLMEFTTDLGNFWGVGQKDKNNGLIITVSKKMRKVWIGTGTGTEKILDDVFLSHLIDSLMIPQFKQEEYFEGIKSGVLGCINEMV